MGRYANLQSLAKTLAARINGVIKIRDSDKLHVVGQLGGRDVRVILEDEHPKVDFEVQARTRREATASFALLHDSGGAGLHKLTRELWDAWDDEDAGLRPSEKLFVTDHLYLTGSRETLADLQELWGRLPAELQQLIIGHQEQSQGRFTFEARRVTFDPWHEVEIAHAPVAIEDLLRLAVRVADAIDGSEGPYR